MATLWIMWRVICWVWRLVAVALTVWVVLGVCFEAWMIAIEQEGTKKHSWSMKRRRWWAGEVKAVMKYDHVPRKLAEEIVGYRALADILRAPCEFVLAIRLYWDSNYGVDSLIGGQ